MKIVHIVEAFAGGTYDFLVSLTNRLPNEEHTIVYGLRPDTPKDFRRSFPSNTTFIHWKNVCRDISPIKDFLALKELIKVLSNIRKFDIIHLHSSKAGFLGRLAAKILGIQSKVIYTSHGASFLREDISHAKRKLFVYLEKLGRNMGGTIVACSKSEAEVFKKHGINAMYIYNGIQCEPDCLHKKDKLKKDKDIFIIGTIGRITFQKNPKLFNTIAEKFLHKKHIKFLWIGDGELNSTLHSPNIIKTGWLSQEKVKEKLGEIDIYLSTSLWEGLPLSVLQAMCFRKPLVLYNCVGNRDLILNNGVLFRTVDEAVKSLNELINDPVKREKLGRNSYNLLIKNFSLDRMIKEYDLLYKFITRKNKRFSKVMETSNANKVR